MKDVHELKIWQKAHQLTLAVYQITATFPREELYGLTSQLRRSCSSIPNRPANRVFLFSQRSDAMRPARYIAAPVDPGATAVPASGRAR